MTSCLELRGIKKAYGRTEVLRGIDLAVEKGEIVGLLGPNGSGKTTTLRLVAGALTPDQGEVRIGGVDPAAEPLCARSQIGYLPERPPLYDSLTVAEYLRFVAAAKGLRGAARRRAIDDSLASFDLAAVRGKVIGHLSKGFRQRVGLAQACLGEPSLLLLDEATSGLDPLQVVEARAFIRRGAAGRGVLLSSHVMQEIAALCTRVVVLHAGRVIAVERPVGEAGAQALHVELAGIAPTAALAQLHALPGVASAALVTAEDDGAFTLRIEAHAGFDVRADVAAALGNARLLALTPAAAALEERFIAAIRASSEATYRRAAE